MAEVSDYYLTLGVSKTASAAEIKRAYRSLAQTLHPDRRDGDPSQLDHFRAVQEAYEVLSNAQTRARYDQIVLGRGRLDAHEPESKGSPLSKHITSEVRLSFDQALHGGDLDVKLASGQTVHVPIPRGVRSGVEIRLRPENSSISADDEVYVVFRVSPSPRFRREGNDLHIVEPITVIDALLGARRSIANAYGRNVKVSIPSGTQPGERLRLRGQGVQTATHCGDLYVEVRIIVPRSLTQEQREALATCVRDLGIQ